MDDLPNGGLALTAHAHTIPVDCTLTPDEAWKELCIFGKRVTDTGTETWAVIECDGQECSGIEIDVEGKPPERAL